jgi:glucose-6-phosphate 1-dehydrogenase
MSRHINKHIAPPVTLVVFGASGDLARRKLMPALYSLYRQELLPSRFAVLGYARTKYSDETFRSLAHDSLKEYSDQEVDEGNWADFAAHLFYQPGSYDDRASFDALVARVDELDARFDTQGNRIFYLSTPPMVFKPISTLLSESGLARRDGDGGFTRLIIEKPFGRDLQSAQDLNRHLHQHFDEDQIYRIDHYLGKETVQNILVFRFGNGIFEPIWNRNYVDNVQITVAESLGIGTRGGYYDQAGAIRDMVQNHVMQLVALTAMEPPVSYDAKAVRDQKVNVMRSIQPLRKEGYAEDCVVRAQYGRGVVDGQEIPGYLETPGVDPHSTTETFVAWRMQINNWRWNGVPFYVRTGKAMAKKLTEINVVFKRPPLMFFEDVDNKLHIPRNEISLRIQPNEGIHLRFDAKRPGPELDVDEVTMDFLYEDAFYSKSAEAYERLLLDALIGDGTLFIRRDEVEVAWDRVTTVLDSWKRQEEEALRTTGKPLRLPAYAPGSWGPPEADALLSVEGRRWRNR